MWDGFITWYEAAVLMGLFASYLTILFLGKAFTYWYKELVRLCTNRSMPLEKKVSKHDDESMPDGLYRPYFHGELVAEYRKSLTKVPTNQKACINIVERESRVNELDEYIEPDTPFVWPRNGNEVTKLWFLFTWPLRFVLFVTIPDSRFRKFRKLYPLTFVMCIAWIAVSSYMVSWMMTVVGDTLGIADSIMGITFLSAGGNMPELVSIVILSRQGNGDMAMSNTLGANTLDILLCLGLPWTIKTIMSGKDVEIVSGALPYSVLSIVICVIGFYSVTAFYKFKLNKKVGAVCLLMYAIFLAFAIAIESNVFFHVNWPMCEDI